MKKSGTLIVIEGKDGSGKEVQSKRLTQALIDRGIDAKRISFPNYESRSSGAVMQYLNGDFNRHHMTEDIQSVVRRVSSLYATDRIATFMSTQPSGKTLFEEYRDGTVIICDRYMTSNVLHQSSFLPRETFHAFIDWLHRLEYIELGLPKPTKVFYLDVHPNTTMGNIVKRTQTLIQSGITVDRDDILENIEHQHAIQDVINDILDYTGWKRIQCDRPGELNGMRAIEDIHQEILSYVERIL